MQIFGRCIVFIDNSNVFKNMPQGYRIDWPRFVSYLRKNDMSIWDQWFFVSHKEERRDAQEKFIYTLQEYGFQVVSSELRKKNIKCNSCGDVHYTYIEKGVDVSIAIKMLKLLYNGAFDTAILVSGDRDLYNVVEEIQNHGRKAIVIAYREAMSKDLADIANKVIYIDDIASEIKLERNNNDDEDNSE